MQWIARWCNVIVLALPLMSGCVSGSGDERPVDEPVAAVAAPLELPPILPSSECGSYDFVCPVRPGSKNLYTLYLPGAKFGPNGASVADKCSRGWGAWTGDPAVAPPGQNPIAVDYDTYQHLSEANSTVRKYLDCYCTAGNWCNLASFSLGVQHVGYSLANYARTTECKSWHWDDASAVLVCDDGEAPSKSSRWNVTWSATAGSAQGGTELSDDLFMFYDIFANCPGGVCVLPPGVQPLPAAVLDLTTTNMRSAAYYDQNSTGGVQFYDLSGAGCGSTCAAHVRLPGRDDGVVSYHSSGGARALGTYCNAFSSSGLVCSGDCLCDTSFLDASRSPLTDVAKFANHCSAFQDEGLQYEHWLHWKYRLGVPDPTFRTGIVDGALFSFMCKHGGALTSDYTCDLPAPSFDPGCHP